MNAGNHTKQQKIFWLGKILEACENKKKIAMEKMQSWPEQGPERLRKEKNLMEIWNKETDRAKKTAESVEEYLKETLGTTYEDRVDKFYEDLTCDASGQNMHDKLKSGLKSLGVRNVETKEFADLLSNEMRDASKKHFTSGTSVRDILKPAVMARKYRVGKNIKGETVFHYIGNLKELVDKEKDKSYILLNDCTAFHMTFNRFNNIKKINAMSGHFQFDRMSQEPFDIHFHQRPELIAFRANIYNQLEMSADLEDLMSRLVSETNSTQAILKHHREKVKLSFDVVTSPCSRIILNPPLNGETATFTVEISNTTKNPLDVIVSITGPQNLFRIKTSTSTNYLLSTSCQIQGERKAYLSGKYIGTPKIEEEITDCSLDIKWKALVDERPCEKSLPIEFNV